MKVSVVIPTYNRAKMLILALDSLIHQDMSKKEYEIIIVDNGSTDGTKDVIRHYIQNHRGTINIKYAVEPKKGDAYARNSGATLAEGEYLYFTDDDALFDSNLLSCLSSILDTYPQVAMVGSRIAIKWDEQPSKWIRSYEYLLGKCSWNKSGYIIKSEGLVIPNGSLAIRKNIFYKVGGNNPGQIGEYLVGNAEVGLFHKVHNLGYPTAFTDDTTMWHMQMKAKNGTLKDIIRRMENIAISDAYTDAIEFHKFNYRSIAIAKWNVLHWLIRLKRAKVMRAYFEYRAAVKYNEWLDLYSDKDFVNSINFKNCELNLNYQRPNIIYRSYKE